MEKIMCPRCKEMVKPYPKKCAGDKASLCFWEPNIVEPVSATDEGNRSDRVTKPDTEEFRTLDYEYEPPQDPRDRFVYKAKKLWSSARPIVGALLPDRGLLGVAKRVIAPASKYGSEKISNNNFGIIIIIAILIVAILLITINN